MSVWTHVAGVVRYDAIRVLRSAPPLASPLSPELPDLGQTVRFDDPPERWKACTVPCGSEGSLQHSLWVNPNVNDLSCYTATIWGDLRDYDNVQEIVQYFARIVRGRSIRQGCFTVQVEDQAPRFFLFVSAVGGFHEVIPEER